MKRFSYRISINEPSGKRKRETIKRALTHLGLVRSPYFSMCGF